MIRPTPERASGRGCGAQDARSCLGHRQAADHGDDEIVVVLGVGGPGAAGARYCLGPYSGLDLAQYDLRVLDAQDEIDAVVNTRWGPVDVGRSTDSRRQDPPTPSNPPIRSAGLCFNPDKIFDRYRALRGRGLRPYLARLCPSMSSA